MDVKTRLITGMKSEIMSGQVSKVELLSLFAHVTGMLVAMQDQRTMTPAEAMILVAKNIQAGNASAIEQLFEGKGGTA